MLVRRSPIKVPFEVSKLARDPLKRKADQIVQASVVVSPSVSSSLAKRSAFEAEPVVYREKGESNSIFFGRRRKEKAGRRKRVYGEVEALPGQTKLETSLVNPQTQREYLSLLGGLMRFITGEARGAGTWEVPTARRELLSQMEALPRDLLDNLIAEYLNEEFFEGGDGGLGSRLIAAVSWALPSLARGAATLPRSRTAAVAFKRLAPGTSRLPVPESLVFGIAMVLAAQGRWTGAVSVMLAHHLYLRPSELGRLTWSMVVFPPPKSLDSKFPTVTLHPLEGGVASKTREYDESMMIDWVWLGEVLRKEKPRHKGSDSVLNLSTTELNSWLSEAAAIMQLPFDLGPSTMNRFRHSGPSADYASQRRSLKESKHRGRWVADSSMRRYQKGARVNELLHKCSSATRAFGAWSLKALPETLIYRCGARLPAGRQ